MTMIEIFAYCIILVTFGLVFLSFLFLDTTPEISKNGMFP